MKKILAKILLILFAAFSFNSVFSSSINFDFEWKSKIKSVSIAEKSWTMEQAINTIWFNALTTFKVIIWWLLVIYMVYAWVMMIISLWSDEEKLSSSKRSLWYSIIWLLFVNIPWTLYNAFTWKATTDNVTWNFWNVKTIYNRNIFMNTQAFWNVVWTILDFLQISIVALAVFMVVLQWVKIMKAMWKDEDVTEAKNKIIWSLWWLIFIWIMVIWRNLVFIWDIDAWRNLFATLANLALYFAWPIAIFFLSLAWYYFITWMWNDDKIKKAKNIVINTFLATLILLWMYTFLLELSTFSL